MADAKTRMPSAEEVEALNAVIKRANEGDPKALEKLRNFLEKNPQLWQHFGDLARVAERAWIALASKADKLVAESLARNLEQLKSELLTDCSNVLEEMLADTVIATWLELHYLRCVDADATGRTLTQASMMVKRLESAQRRHTNAIKQFAQIKKLLPQSKTMPDLKIFPYRAKDSA